MPQPFGPSIRHQVFIDVPPEKVYSAVSTAEGWNAFFTSNLEVEPVPGGRMVWRWRDWGPNFYTVEAEAKVVAADCPTLFAFEWYPAGREHATTVTFDIAGEFGGTVVRLEESGYPDSPEGREAALECASGWGEALALLKFYLERGIVYTQPRRNGGAA